MRLCYIGDLRSVFVKRPVKWFADRGHELHVISPHPLRIRSRRVRAHVAALPACQRVIPGAALGLRALGLHRLLRTIAPDVVHCHYALSSALPLLAARGFPRLLTVYGSDIYRPGGPVGEITNLLALWRADTVAASSHEMMAFIAQRYKLPYGRLVHIRWGHDLRLFRPRPEARRILAERFGITAEHLVFSPRGLQPIYNQRLLLEAFPEVVARHPGTLLVLLTKRFKGTFDLDFLPEAVRAKVLVIEQHLSPAEMALFTAASDLTVSIPASDQLSACIVQAMACGSIPLVSDLAVYRRTITDGENGFIVDPHDREALAKTIVKVLEDKQRFKREFAPRNRRIVEEHLDEAQWMPRLEALYERLANGGN